MGQHESPGVTLSSSQQGYLTGYLTPREKEKGRRREREREMNRSLNIMTFVQIKSGRAELPMKIFIIPQTFGYRGVWN